MDTRPAKPAKPPKAGAKPERKSVMLELDTHRILDKSAKKLKLSNGEYVSAAIAYFAQTGLDPTKDQPVSLAVVSMKVDAMEAAIRKQNHEIGTRLVQIIRTWEKNSYAFMQNVQASTNNYLEMIESNLLQHQVEVEGKLLAPLVEGQFKGILETELVRGLVTYLYMMAPNPNEPAEKHAEKFSVHRAHNTAQRDKELAKALHEFQKTNAVPLPKPTRRPAVIPVPAAPPKPAAPASTAPAAPPKS